MGAVFLHELGADAAAMFPYASLDVVGHANVEHAARAIGHEVDVEVPFAHEFPLVILSEAKDPAVLRSDEGVVPIAPPRGPSLRSGRRGALPTEERALDVAVAE